MESWSVLAQNLPEHAGNAIHTDEGARAAGFPAALVAGVTTYAYLTHPVIASWGLDWVAAGGGEVRFRRPVFAGDLVRCEPAVEEHADEASVAATTGGVDPAPARRGDGEAERVRATLRVVRDGERTGVAEAMRSGEELPQVEVRLEGDWGADYAARAGDDLDVFVRRGVVHPAVWPALANHVVHRYVARGSWIHTRSLVRHHALAPAGAEALVRAVVVRRWDDRLGERALLDVAIEAEGAGRVARVEHEALVHLHPT
jgi:acyl dehydratase